MKSSNKRVAALRERRAAMDQKRCEFYLTKIEREKVIKYINKIRGNQ